MAYDGDTLIVTGRDQNSNSVQTTWKYINTQATNSQVKTNANALLRLSTNTTLTIIRRRDEDITTA